MKKQLTGFGLIVLIIAAVAFAAFIPQQEKKNDPKEKHQDHGKSNPKEKGNQGKNDAKGNQGQDNANSNNKNKDDIKENQGKSNENVNKGNRDRTVIYNWDRETFRDRQKIRNKEKVTICHKFNRADEPAVTISVSSNAIKAHMDHGDVMGDCPAVTRGRFSDFFLKKRTDYYNTLENGQEQVWYSQSVLDYALARLADSRAQLAIYRSNNMPPAEIERKEVVVVELERNVGLLESLLGVAANIIVNKLQ